MDGMNKKEFDRMIQAYTDLSMVYISLFIKGNNRTEVERDIMTHINDSLDDLAKALNICLPREFPPIGVLDK